MKKCFVLIGIAQYYSKSASFTCNLVTMLAWFKLLYIWLVLNYEECIATALNGLSTSYPVVKQNILTRLLYFGPGSL